MLSLNEGASHDSENCPLCGQSNQCGHLSLRDNTPCWCTERGVTFPESLLNKVSATDGHKACICKACVLSHIQDNP